MAICIKLLHLVTLLMSLSCLVMSKSCWDYVIIGAGPSGLQMGYFLERSNRDYIILEQANMSGSFFLKYPRHNKLISLNKRYTGKTNAEFNLRHDWNSLLSDEEDLLFRHFSRDFFPHKDSMVTYLNTFEKHWSLNIQYNTDVVDVQKATEAGQRFTLTDQDYNVYHAKVLLVATGLWKPNIPDIGGIDLAQGYEDLSTDTQHFEGKTVLVLGNGNSAFETAQSMYGHVNLIHLVGRSRVRLAWETHYVGDVRGVNNELLDTYQLKSMDGLLEGDINLLQFTQHGDQILVSLRDTPHINDNFALRQVYDRVIRCLGFHFDTTIFNSSSLFLRMGDNQISKFPKLGGDYQSVSVPGLYVLGVASHSLDYKQSAGGFIHGFRYTVRALHHILEERQHGVSWPSTSKSITDLLPTLVKRLNEASGIYQMFSVLCDVIVIQRNGTWFQYIEEFPVALLADLTNITGHEVGSHIVVCLEYGKNYSGPGKDVFMESRATGFPNEAHKSNFLHPVLYYYDKPLTAISLLEKPSDWILPRPSRLHHVVEDFLTDWSRAEAHVLPLRHFLEHCVGRTLSNRFSEDCFQIYLTQQTVPLHCQKYMESVSITRKLGQPWLMEASR